MIALVYLFNLQEFVRERERDALRLVQVNVELLGKYRTRLESSIYYTTKLDVYIHCIQKKMSVYAHFAGYWVWAYMILYIMLYDDIHCINYSCI